MDIWVPSILPVHKWSFGFQFKTYHLFTFSFYIWVKSSIPLPPWFLCGQTYHSNTRKQPGLVNAALCNSSYTSFSTYCSRYSIWSHTWGRLDCIYIYICGSRQEVAPSPFHWEHKHITLAGKSAITNSITNSIRLKLKVIAMAREVMFFVSQIYELVFISLNFRLKLERPHQTCPRMSILILRRKMCNFGSIFMSK